ncbi:hypothetical protein GCM10018987_54460 [Streptomyces cremeus]
MQNHTAELLSATVGAQETGRPAARLTHCPVSRSDMEGTIRTHITD